jgi:hypothetical protein
MTASLKNNRHLIQLWLGFTTLPDSLVSGAEEVGEPLQYNDDEEDGGAEVGQLEQNGGDKGEVGQSQLRCALPGQEAPDVRHHHAGHPAAEACVLSTQVYLSTMVMPINCLPSRGAGRRQMMEA